MDSFFSQEFRCNCGKLLGKGMIIDGNVAIKCRRCGVIYDIKGLNSFINDGEGANRYGLILNGEGKIVNANNSAIAMLGYSSQELIGKNIEEIDRTLPPGFYNKIISSANRVSNFFRLDTLHRTNSGTTIPVIVRFKIFRSAKEDMMILAIADRTLQNGQNEKDLAIGVPAKYCCDFICEVDVNGNIVYVDPRVEKIIGYKPEEIIGEALFDLFPKQRESEIKSWFQKFSSRHEPYRILDSKFICKDRSVKNLESYLVPHFDDIGNFLGYQVLNWKNKIKMV
jgi:PAS domain S-box-containing protein